MKREIEDALVPIMTGLIQNDRPDGRLTENCKTIRNVGGLPRELPTCAF